MGDFNFAGIDWNKSEFDDSDYFMKCVNDNFLIQCVNNEIRGKNILDLVFVSEENMVENLEVGELFDNSDHNIIRWTFVASKDKSVAVVYQKTYNYFKADFDKIRDEAKLLD